MMIDATYGRHVDRIGVLGLDTSHAASFADVIIERDDAAITAVWDGGQSREDAYVESFCKEYDARRFDDPFDMVDAVDAAMVLPVDWEQHVPLARPFLSADVPTLIDKPLAGSLSHIDQLAELAEGTQLFGGSAVPFHPYLESLPRNSPDRSLYAAGYNDFFYYRVHLSDTIRGLAGEDWTSVEPTSEPGTTIRITFQNGTHALARYDGGRMDSAFGVLDVAEQVQTVEVPSDEETLAELYRPYIDTFLDVVAGRRDETNRVIDSGRLALAVEAALETESRITPDAHALNDIRVDSTEFVADYQPYY